MLNRLATWTLCAGVVVGSLVHACTAGFAEAAPVVTATTPTATTQGPVTPDVAAHELAEVAIKRAADQLGQPGGIYRVPRYHIPLPSELDKPVKVLEKNYASDLSNTLEMAINRAAEATVPALAADTLKALPQVAFADPGNVLHAVGDAVTRQVQAQSEPAFAADLAAQVTASLSATKATEALQRMQARYEQLTDSPFPAFDLQAYTRDQVVSVFFAAVGEQEQIIRTEPSARSTEALKQVFTTN